MIDTHEPARRKERVVQLLLAPGIAALLGGLVRLRVLAVDRLSLGPGNARTCRMSTAAHIALACSPKQLSRPVFDHCWFRDPRRYLCVGPLAGTAVISPGVERERGALLRRGADVGREGCASPRLGFQCGFTASRLLAEPFGADSRRFAQSTRVWPGPVGCRWVRRAAAMQRVARRSGGFRS
jgi:hypothetical protein